MPFLQSSQKQEKGLSTIKGSLAEDSNRPQNFVQKELEAHSIRQI